MTKKEEVEVKNSAATLQEEARKAETRADVDAQTNKTTAPNEVNIIAELTKKPEEAKKAEPISDAEYERRTKLDVSDPLYINPSLGHWKK